MIQTLRCYTPFSHLRNDKLMMKNVFKSMNPVTTTNVKYYFDSLPVYHIFSYLYGVYIWSQQLICR